MSDDNYILGDLCKAIQDADFAYYKELMETRYSEIETEVDRLKREDDFNRVRLLYLSFRVYRKNPKIFNHLVKYKNLYTDHEIQLIGSKFGQYSFCESQDMEDMINILPSDLLQKSIVCNNIFSRIASNYSRDNSYEKILELLLSKEIYPLKDFDGNFISHFYLIGTIKDNSLIKKITDYIRCNYDIKFLEDNFMSLDDMIESKLFMDERLLQPEEKIYNSILPNNKKLYKKLFYTEILNREKLFINTELIQILSTFKKLKIASHHVESFISFYKKIPYRKSYVEYAIFRKTFNLIQDNIIDLCLLLSEKYSQKKIVNLLIKYIMSDDVDVFDSVINDTIRMIKSFNELDQEKKQRFPLARNFDELHDKLSQLLQKMEQEFAELPTQITLYEKMIRLEPLFKNNLTKSGLGYYIPLSNHDLIDIGTALSICVGNGHYAQESLSESLAYIVLTDLKNSKPMYCISFYLKNENKFYAMMEIEPGTIEQAKGFHNCEMPADHLELIKSILNELYPNKD